MLGFSRSSARLVGLGRVPQVKAEPATADHFSSPNTTAPATGGQSRDERQGQADFGVAMTPLSVVNAR